MRMKSLLKLGFLLDDITSIKKFKTNQQIRPPPARRAGGDWSSWYQTYWVANPPLLLGTVLAADPMFLQDSGSWIFWPEMDHLDLIDPSGNSVSTHVTSYPNSTALPASEQRKNALQAKRLWNLSFTCRYERNSKKQADDELRIHLNSLLSNDENVVRTTLLYVRVCKRIGIPTCGTQFWGKPKRDVHLMKLCLKTFWPWSFGTRAHLGNSQVENPPSPHQKKNSKEANMKSFKRVAESFANRGKPWPNMSWTYRFSWKLASVIAIIA